MPSARTIALALTWTAAASLAAATTTPAYAAHDAIAWGPVVTVHDGGFDTLRSVTTDNGMVVAVWNGNGFHNLWMAVHRTGKPWSTPVKIAGTAAAFDITRSGTGAWLVWQDFAHVSALHVAGDGARSSTTVLGPSSDPFISDPTIAAGANGSVAAAWHRTGAAPLLAYRPPGGSWSAAEDVPQGGNTLDLVVGAKGTAQLLLTKDNPDSEHQQISYLRRTAAGAWGTPFVVSSAAAVPTAAGNANGDIVVGWEIVNGDGTFSLAARYKSSAHQSFDATHHLDDTVPQGAEVALAMGADGSLVAAYQVTDQGSEQIQLTPADSTGLWLDPQDLSMTGRTYDVTSNAAGDALVTSLQGSGTQVVRCPAGGTCGGTETNPATKFRFPSTTLAPDGAVTMLWGRGCHTEECRPTKLVAQRGR